jgi:Uncharacterized protein conserved in bacteria
MLKLISKVTLALSLLLFSTVSSFSFDPSNTKCIAPANAGGDWDFTCRAVGKALQDQGLIKGSMEVTNMAGGGGGKAFAEVVNKRNTDDSLIVAFFCNSYEISSKINFQEMICHKLDGLELLEQIMV